MVTHTKKLIRARILALRDAIDPEAKRIASKKVCDTLWQLIVNKNYRIIHAFIPMRNEIDINPFLNECLKDKIRIYTPKTYVDRVMINYRYWGQNRLIKGIYGTSYPDGKRAYRGPYDLIIVPGLAFDNSGYRLGYGGGYYDGFLADHPEAYKVGVGYNFQLLDKVPIEEHDQKVDKVITG